jgi:hypothetical protein
MELIFSVIQAGESVHVDFASVGVEVLQLISPIITLELSRIHILKDSIFIVVSFL